MISETKCGRIHRPASFAPFTDPHHLPSSVSSRLISRLTICTAQGRPHNRQQLRLLSGTLKERAKFGMARLLVDFRALRAGSGTLAYPQDEGQRRDHDGRRVENILGQHCFFLTQLVDGRARVFAFDPGQVHAVAITIIGFEVEEWWRVLAIKVKPRCW